MERDLAGEKGWEKKRKENVQADCETARLSTTNCFSCKCLGLTLLTHPSLYPPPPPPPTHTHTPSLHLFYFGTLPVSRRIKKEGKTREWAGGDSEKGVNEEGEFKKRRKKRENRLLLGLAKGQSWQAWRLNCRVKILFIILCSLFPNSPLLCHSQSPASMSPPPQDLLDIVE